MVGHVAGGGRRWPEVAEDGRRWVAKAPSPSNGGVILVKFEISEFLKWWFGERRVGPLEGVFRGEDDGVVRGGQGGVGNVGKVVKCGGESGFLGVS